MKRPPDKKMMLAATLLLVAASLVLAQPAVGTHPAPTFAIAKLLGRT